MPVPDHSSQSHRQLPVKKQRAAAAAAAGARGAPGGPEYEAENVEQREAAGEAGSYSLRSASRSEVGPAATNE